MAQSKYFPDLKNSVDDADVEQVETAFSSVETDMNNRYTKTEVDTIVSGLNYDITEYITQSVNELNTEIDGKVDKVSGKGLSSNDYTTEEKTKLGNLPESVYSKTEVDSKLNIKENTANKSTEISETSTDVQYPTAKAVFETTEKAKSDTKDYCNNVFSNALKGSKSGATVNIDDISPIEHEIDVSIKSKNLIPYPYSINGTQTVNGVTYTVNSDGSITLNGTATDGTATLNIFNNTQNPLKLTAGNYTLSGIPADSGASPTTFYLQIYYDGKWGAIDVGNGGKITASSTISVSRITLFVKAGVEFSNLTAKPQLEEGSAATEYTQCVSDFSSVTVSEKDENGAVAATYTPSSDGKVGGVKSIYPITTLSSDNSGAVITAKYNRDINRAFSELEEKLTNAIVSMGGNV